MTARRGGAGWAVGLVGGKQRWQDSLAELGVEDREPLAVVGQHVAVLALDAADEPVQAQPAQRGEAEAAAARSRS